MDERFGFPVSKASDKSEKPALFISPERVIQPMDILGQVSPAFAESRQSPAVKAYVLYFIGLIVGLGLAGGAFFLAFRSGVSGAINLPFIALTAVSGLLWFAYMILGDLLLKAAVILQADTEDSFKKSLDTVKEDLLALLAVTFITGLIGVAVSLVFIPLKLALPGLMLGISVIQFGINLLLGAVFGYALFFRILKKERILDSIAKSANLFLEKPREVLAAFLVVLLLSLLILGGLVLVILVLVFLGSLVLAAFKTSAAGIVLLGLLALLAFATFVLTLSFFNVWVTRLFKRYFIGFTHGVPDTGNPEALVEKARPSQPVKRVSTAKKTAGRKTQRQKPKKRRPKA